MKKSGRFWAILVLVMLLGLMGGTTVNAATTFTALRVGDVIKAGDIVKLSDHATKISHDSSGITGWDNEHWTLIRYSGFKTGDSGKYEAVRDPNGGYYCFESTESESQFYRYGYRLIGVFQASDASQGLIVTAVENNTVTLDVLEHVHNYSKNWSSDASGHWHACTTAAGTCNAPKSGAAAHSYGTSGNARFTCAVCGYVDPAKKAETEEKITIKKAPASVKAKVKKNKVTVSWKKIKKTKKTGKLLAQIRGIQVQYSTDPMFGKNPVTKNIGKKKTKTVLKLDKKTMYYIHVRYVGKDGVSKWSRIRKVKTK